MALSVQDLMKPIYKVIAGYFFSPYSIGDLLKQSDSGAFYVTKTEGYVDGVKVDIDDYVSAEVIAKYPRLFRPLQWWEERSESEMPEYIRINQTWVVKAKKHYVAHPRYGEKGKWFEAADSSAIEPFYAYSSVSGPATETEYNDYLQSLKQKQ